MDTISRNLKQQLVIIIARFDALKKELLPFLRGHAQARSRSMPFLHYSDIETRTVSKYELLGLKTKLIIVAVSSILGGILLQAWD
jgi:hypothetical protein